MKAQAGRYEVLVASVLLPHPERPTQPVGRLQGEVVELTSEQAERLLKLGAVKVHEVSRRSPKKSDDDSKSDEE